MNLKRFLKAKAVPEGVNQEKNAGPTARIQPMDQSALLLVLKTKFPALKVGKLFKDFSNLINLFKVRRYLKEEDFQVRVFRVKDSQVKVHSLVLLRRVKAVFRQDNFRDFVSQALDLIRRLELAAIPALEADQALNVLAQSNPVILSKPKRPVKLIFLSQLVFPASSLLQFNPKFKLSLTRNQSHFLSLNFKKVFAQNCQQFLNVPAVKLKFQYIPRPNAALTMVVNQLKEGRLHQDHILAQGLIRRLDHIRIQPPPIQLQSSATGLRSILEYQPIPVYQNLIVLIRLMQNIIVLNVRGCVRQGVPKQFLLHRQAVVVLLVSIGMEQPA